MRISPYDFEAVKLFSGIVFDADRKSYLTLNYSSYVLLTM